MVKVKRLLYQDFLKMLSSAYERAGLPLTMPPLETFALFGTDGKQAVPEDFFNDIVYAERALVVGSGKAARYMPLEKAAIRVLKALDQLYIANIPITADLIVRIIHAEKTRYKDEPLLDKKMFISFTPWCASIIHTYISDVELRALLESTFTGAAGPIISYNASQNAEVLSSMMKEATKFQFCNANYYAIDLRPSYVKAIRHLTNLLYYNLFCFTYAKDHLNEVFVLEAETFIYNMIHFHTHRLPILSGLYTVKELYEAKI